ncbi:DUF6415 family natural product biosynthesis protein [Streptomyces massasporeus]|uniref:DUF6415 family natural product biosynthesis protein n=1 Tax=Streptomyces massasporeus TaxID=67324 RepID=UPI00371EC3C3
MYTVDRGGLVKSDSGSRSRPTDTNDESASPALAARFLRAEAGWFIAQKTLPGHGTVKRFEESFRKHLDQLIPEVERLASEKPADDVPSKVALAAIEESRRRMDEEEAAGLKGEVERVKNLAQSVMSLSHHQESLSGVAQCLLCDHMIMDNQSWEPYEYRSRSGETGKSGRVHADCAARIR